MSELVYLLPFLIGLTLLVLMASGDDRMPAAPFSHDAAEHLAKAMRNRSVFVVATTGALVAYGLVNQDLVDMMKFSALVFVPAIIQAVARWLEATRGLRMLQRSGVESHRLGDVVVLENGDQRQLLHVNAWLITRASQHGVPRATL